MVTTEQASLIIPCVLSRRLVVAEGGEDVTIKVSDEGGGIPRSGLARIWTYLYSTAKSRVQVEELQVCFCQAIDIM
jgi:K+-sensing histidine kinase KdpD